MIDLLIAPISSLLERFIPDADTKQKLAHDIATMAHKQAHAEVMAQIKANEVQAAHKSLFVAGARPATMWICNLGLLYAVLIHPFLDVWLDMPDINVEILYPVLMGLLGLGGARTFEKVKGVAREK